MKSQNARFRGESPGDDEFEPAGHGLADRLAAGLAGLGLQPRAVENWRDSGWSIDFTIRNAPLQLTLASAGEPGAWFLQIAELNPPGLVARLFGVKRVDRTSELSEAAKAVHRILVDAGCTVDLWRPDNDPESGGTTKP